MGYMVWGSCGVMLLTWSAGFLSLLFHMLCKVRPPKRPAECAMPNDPRHITTHDASLPRERGKDSLHQTNSSSVERSLLNVTAENQHDSRLGIIYIINLHFAKIWLLWRAQRYRNTHTVISFLTMIIPYVTRYWKKLHLQQWSGRDKSGMRGLKSLIWRELWTVKSQTDVDGSSRWEE